MNRHPNTVLTLQMAGRSVTITTADDVSADEVVAWLHAALIGVGFPSTIVADAIRAAPVGEAWSR